VVRNSQVEGKFCKPFDAFSALTAATTFASAVSYAFMRDTYKFSHRSYDHQFGKKLAAFTFFVGFNGFFLWLFPVRRKNEESVI